MRNGHSYAIKALLAFAALLFCVAYARYIWICGYRVPIMDYVEWIAKYGPKIHSGEFSPLELFVQGTDQMQPGSIAISLLFLEHSDYDVWPMMVAGCILRCGVALALGIGFLGLVRKKYGHISTLAALYAVAIVGLSLNLNQWEMMNEPFELANAIRLLATFVLFWLSSKTFSNLLEWNFRKQIGSMGLLSLLAILISLTLMGAYFVSVLGAISIAGCLLIWEKRKEIRPRHLLHGVIWGASVLGVLCAYLMLTGSGVSASVSGALSPFEIVKGMLLYFGSAILPQSICEQSRDPFYLAGAIVIVIGVAVVFIYMKERLYRISYFPIMMVLYGVICGLVICIGRIPAYGKATMCSSRYCVESVIGCIGILMMMALLGEEKGGKTLLPLAAGAIVSLGFTVLCFSSEMGIAPYRAVYQQQIIQRMADMDAYTDEELGIFQNAPENCRVMVQFFKENNLSIFSEDSELLPVGEQ